MKKTALTGLSLTCLLSALLVISSCTNAPAKDRWCSFALRSNAECGLKKDQTVCIRCSGNGCPVKANDQIIIADPRDTTKRCTVSLGNRISDCGKCEDLKDTVILISVLQ